MGRLAVTGDRQLNLASATILVVGASEVEIDILLQLLGGFGAAALKRASDLDAAKAAAQQGGIDLVIVDHRVGEDSGFEFTRWLRRIDGAEGRRAPVILTASYVSQVMLDTAISAGVNFVVAKPITPRLLFERLYWIVRENRDFIECESYVGPDRRVRALGPPAGMAGRRVTDLKGELGDAVEPNMSQDDIDGLLNPVRAVGA